jgi:hypothetical protein
MKPELILEHLLYTLNSTQVSLCKEPALPSWTAAVCHRHWTGQQHKLQRNRAWPVLSKCWQQWLWKNLSIQRWGTAGAGAAAADCAPAAAAAAAGRQWLIHLPCCCHDSGSVGSSV